MRNKQIELEPSFFLKSLRGVSFKVTIILENWYTTFLKLPELTSLILESSPGQGLLNKQIIIKGHTLSNTAFSGYNTLF